MEKKKKKSLLDHFAHTSEETQEVEREGAAGSFSDDSNEISTQDEAPENQDKHHHKKFDKFKQGS